MFFPLKTLTPPPFGDIFSVLNIEKEFIFTTLFLWRQNVTKCFGLKIKEEKNLQQNEHRAN